MSHEIKCPKCGEAFTIDEASYAEIVQQVRTAEFDRELSARLHAAAENSKKDLELARSETARRYDEQLNAKSQEISELKSKLESADELHESQQLVLQKGYEQQIGELKSQLASIEEVHQSRELVLKSKLDDIEKLHASKELMLKQNYEQQIRDREDTIERLRDMKSRLSTKMVGESLEQHCQNEFNAIRANAYPRAEFGKDNTVSASGSKGDFIFRDFAEDGTELVSIMFEMKNESDTTATKHKNEHFFKELDKDRTEKGCEYAVLVSLLEADNELYNRGIVDVSYEYPRMYVIRPQFFLTLISIIVNTARNSLAYKSELARVKNQNIDITNFEQKLADFKSSFALNSDRATANFNKAIEDIDKSIKYLENTKEALLKTIKNFDTAGRKLDDLTVKRLTRGNETMTRMFAELDNNAD